MIGCLELCQIESRFVGATLAVARTKGAIWRNPKCEEYNLEIKFISQAQSKEINVWLPTIIDFDLTNITSP